MLNHIDIMGRCTKDPELRTTVSGLSVATVTIACDRDFPDKSGNRDTDFVNVVAWRGTGEFLSKYFSKGSQIVVSGRLQSRDWTDKNGSKRTEWEVLADNIYFCGDKKGSAPAKFVELDESDGELPL